MNIFGEPNLTPLYTDLEPFEIYRSISYNQEDSFLFESLDRPRRLAEITVMGFAPVSKIRGYSDYITVQRNNNNTTTHRTDDPFGALQEMMRTSTYDKYRYMGGAVGIVNYDAVTLTEELPRAHHIPQPLFEFGLYDDGILIDNHTGETFYFWYDTDRSHILDNMQVQQHRRFQTTTPKPETDINQFTEMINRAHRYIYDGDIFQVVLSRRFSFDITGDPLELYARLRHLNPSPYMFHLKQGSRVTIGASPEMLIRITKNHVETFPIAGTRPIGDTKEETARLAEELKSNIKELAEHTMLVDLGRNDIGRVCKYGTVKPISLMEVKRFSHVQHLVTHVAGEMDTRYNMFDAFKAVFPAGTVTGAPKVRAMEIIDELESKSRGPYAGAVGYFSYNGCCDFAIAIRSIFIQDGKGIVQSGAGIVSDAKPAQEFAETEKKSGAMLQAVMDGAET
ncbi:MAG: anthranilate synthase component I family protein [Cenarchaeum sp. SB0665_bin_23]|nr:anthranilate synthase component I family protein [Cenarchaeum sp. SB0665_bin_23]MYG33606.1 anthranilate synthase component I family protein [Cenarchaeum sp. SB0677_bin_16]